MKRQLDETSRSPKIPALQGGEDVKRDAYPHHVRISRYLTLADRARIVGWLKAKGYAYKVRPIIDVTPENRYPKRLDHVIGLAYCFENELESIEFRLRWT